MWASSDPLIKATGYPKEQAHQFCGNWIQILLATFRYFLQKKKKKKGERDENPNS